VVNAGFRPVADILIIAVRIAKTAYAGVGLIVANKRRPAFKIHFFPIVGIAAFFKPIDTTGLAAPLVMVKTTYRVGLLVQFLKI
jgi:hypothetical protein